MNNIIYYNIIIYLSVFLSFNIAIVTQKVCNGKGTQTIFLCYYITSFFNRQKIVSTT